MLYVALALAAVLAVTVLAFAGLLRSQSRGHARREDLLVNQLCALAGRPWSTPPAQEAASFAPERELALIVDPSQWPDDELGA